MQKLRIDNNHHVSYKQQKFEATQIPTIVFLHGLMSDMNGTKAISIEKFCQNEKYNFVAFDNLGHGDSTGEFTDHTISCWLDTTKELINKLNLRNIILIGSSMGGWLSLLLGMKKLKNISAIIMLAPAPDFTKTIWENLSKEQQNKMLDDSLIQFRGIPISYKLIEDGKKHLIMDNGTIDLEVPTIIIHGMKDESVDYKLSIELTEKIQSNYLCTKLLKNSDHRLSSPSDLALINNSIKEIAELLKGDI